MIDSKQFLYEFHPHEQGNFLTCLVLGNTRYETAFGDSIVVSNLDPDPDYITAHL